MLLACRWPGDRLRPLPEHARAPPRKRPAPIFFSIDRGGLVFCAFFEAGDGGVEFVEGSAGETLAGGAGIGQNLAAGGESGEHRTSNNEHRAANGGGNEPLNY